MDRILDLQKLSTDDQGFLPDPETQGASTCSDHNCACSTNSNLACYAGNEFIVI